MPTVSKNEAAEKLALVVETAKPTDLGEIYAELFPEKLATTPLSAGDLARHIRNGLAAEEIVDLWNVVFPADYNVWYNEEDNEIHYNEEVVGYADANGGL
jgi:hypothetical protein